MNSYADHAGHGEYLHFVQRQVVLWPVVLVVMVSVAVALWCLHVAIGHQQAQADFDRFVAVAKLQSRKPVGTSAAVTLDQLSERFALQESGANAKIDVKYWWRYKSFYEGELRFESFQELNGGTLAELKTIVERLRDENDLNLYYDSGPYPGFSGVRHLVQALRGHMWFASYSGNWQRVMEIARIVGDLSDAYRSHDTLLHGLVASACEILLVRTVVECAQVFPHPFTKQQIDEISSMAKERFDAPLGLADCVENEATLGRQLIVQCALPMEGRELNPTQPILHPVVSRFYKDLDNWPVLLDFYPLVYRHDLFWYEHWMQESKSNLQVLDDLRCLEHAVQAGQQPRWEMESDVERSFGSVFTHQLFLHAQSPVRMITLVQNQVLRLRQSWHLLPLAMVLGSGELPADAVDCKHRCLDLLGEQAVKDMADPKGRAVRFLVDDNSIVVVSVGRDGELDYTGNRVDDGDDVYFQIYRDLWLTME